MTNKSLSKIVDYGVLAEFANPTELLLAAEKTKAAGYKHFETFSPFPIHGMDDAMGLKPSILGWIVFCGGTIGLSAGMGLQTWAQVVAYPYIISGKPLFSYPAFVPVAFELLVLFAAFATVFGMFALNGLPRFNHPLFESRLFQNVNCDSFVLLIEAKDKKYNQAEVSTFLKNLKAKAIEVVKEEV